MNDYWNSIISHKFIVLEIVFTFPSNEEDVAREMLA
jgi:hypothetical protein